MNRITKFNEADSAHHYHAGRRGPLAAELSPINHAAFLCVVSSSSNIVKVFCCYYIENIRLYHSILLILSYNNLIHNIYISGTVYFISVLILARAEVAFQCHLYNYFLQMLPLKHHFYAPKCFLIAFFRPPKRQVHYLAETWSQSPY